MEGFDTKGRQWATQDIIEAVMDDAVLRNAVLTLVCEVTAPERREFLLGQLIWQAAIGQVLWVDWRTEAKLSRIGKPNMEHADFHAVADAVVKRATEQRFPR